MNEDLLRNRKQIRQEFEIYLLDKYEETQYKKIMKAFDYCVKYHNGQFRKSGEEYFTHPVAVAKESIDLKLDYETVIAGLLHDTLEDTELKYEIISKEFSPAVAAIVEGVTKLDLVLDSKNKEDYENFKKLFLALVKDSRVLFVNLLDRLHNIRTRTGHKNILKRKR